MKNYRKARFRLKRPLLRILFTLSSLGLCAQGTIDTVQGNSLYTYVQERNPALQYSYLEQSQTHDYSGNWDIDGDGKTDSIFWIGNGGAHLMYHVKIALSHNRQTYKYPDFEIDLPFPESLEVVCGNVMRLVEFSVGDFDKDGRNEIYIFFDSRGPIPAKWRHKGISSHHIMLKFQRNKIRVLNFGGCR